MRKIGSDGTWTHDAAAGESNLLGAVFGDVFSFAALGQHPLDAAGHAGFAWTPGAYGGTGIGALVEAVPVGNLGEWEDGSEVMAAAVALGFNATAAVTTAGKVMTSYVSTHSASLFNIKVNFAGSLWTADLQKAFVRAVDNLESIIQGDLPNASIRSAAGITVVDDLEITATLANIDGVGKILGQAGPQFVRAGSNIPVVGAMTFDVADAAKLAGAVRSADATHSETLWDVVVEHEMLHVLGIGSIWSIDHLLTTKNGALVYTGQSGGLEYAKLLNPAAKVAVPIPVEMGGGAGTAGSHWKEAAFTKELMTGYINDSYNPVSKMTAASLGDLGYKLAAQSAWHVDPYGIA